MARKDIHRPSAINPSDYGFVACDYYGGNAFEQMYVAEDRKIFRAHMEKTGGKFAKQCTEGFGTCYVCGATALYVAKFHHVPTNTYIVTGMDCAAKMEIGDPIAFKSFKKRIAAGLKLTRGKLKAREILTERGLMPRAWDIFEAAEELCKANRWQEVERQEYTVRDIVFKVIQYGNISDGQAKLLVKLFADIDARAELKAKRAAEMADAAPVPVTSERVSVKGKVLTTRTDEGQYGTVTKMLVQTEAGYKLWGTVPSILLGEGIKGAVVEFSAKVERSAKDEKFGFFSRPTKASIVTPAPTQEAAP